MNDHEQIDLPDYVTSFSKLAAVLEIGRGQLHEIRLRDPRFPKITTKGWACVPAAMLLHLRKMEKATFNWRGMLDRDPTDTEKADLLGWTEKAIEKMKKVYGRGGGL